VPPAQNSDEPVRGIAWWIDSIVDEMNSPREHLPVAQTPLRSYDDSISKAASVLCDNGKTYVIKAPHRDPHAHLRTRSLFTDQVVGRLGTAMGAPVPPTTLVELPELLARYHPILSHFVPGPAHASQEVATTVINRREVLYRDYNVERFCDLAVLHGLCLAGDAQFLYEVAPPHRVYSADHGHFFPGKDAWTALRLNTEPPVLGPSVDIIGGVRPSREQLVAAVSKLRGINDAEIVRAVAAPPEGWGIPVPDRVAAGMFISRRREDLMRLFRLDP
jgi:hypothetical protein